MNFKVMVVLFVLMAAAPVYAQKIAVVDMKKVWESSKEI